MSVIFGIIDQEKIIIAGDKRISSIGGNFISDDGQKVFAINERLAIAIAGNVAIEKAILTDIEKNCNVSNITTDDLVEIINNFYKRVLENNCDSIYMLSFYCLIAGMGRDRKPHLVNARKFKNGFSAKDVPMALYHPADTKQDDCNQIFAKNYKLHHGDFCERTVQEISVISKIVSPTGNKWEYNILSKVGVMYDF